MQNNMLTLRYIIIVKGKLALLSFYFVFPKGFAVAPDNPSATANPLRNTNAVYEVHHTQRDD
jgi:hypothetical protein